MQPEDTMKEVYYGDFRVVVVEHIRRIEVSDPEAYSTPWFLLKYLRRLERFTLETDAQHQVQSSVRSLLRFYLDQLQEASELGQVCNDIFEAYRRSRL